MSIIYKTPVSEEQQKAVVQAQQNKIELDQIRASIKNESTTRANDDIVLRQDISALRGVVTEEINARASETAILTADLATEINQRETAVFNLRNDLSAEILARETSESNIEDEFNAKIDAEKTARSQALSDMQAAILAAMGNDKAAEAIENEQLRQQIEAEAANQAAGLTALTNRVETEEGTRVAEDTKLSNAIADEAAARKNADLQLQNTFNTAISTETNARVACDTALSTALTNAINTEIQARNDAIDSASKITKAYVDQQVAAVEGNLNVFTAPTATQNGKSGIVPATPAGMLDGILTTRGWRTPEDASLTISVVPTQTGTLTYTSNTTQTPTWTNFDSKKLKIEGELSGVDAKTYTVKFTPIDMYMWSDTLDQQPKTATWKIEPRLLTKPSASVREFTFAANTTHGLNVSIFDAVYESQTGTISASNVNTYTAVYKLRSPANTRWNDGSVADVEISWQIKPLKLPKPSAAVTEFDCDENVKNLDVANLNSTYIRKKSGTTSESEPGNYSVVYELIDKSNTQWSDSSTDDVTINWKINLRVLTLEQSSGFAQVGTLTYNGNSQSVTVQNFDAKYHVLGSDTAKVDAGTYTVTVTPRVGCVWNDMTKTAKTVSWTIQPKTLAIPYADVTAFEYDGAAKTLQVKNYDPATMTQNGTVSTAEAGEYSVKYILKSKSNYKWADNSVTDKVIEWNVGSKELPKPSCATTQFTYSGDTKTITVLNVDTNYMTETGTKSEVNAGEYQVVYHLTNTLRAKWADGSVEDVVITWKIDRKKLTATQSNISKTGDFTYNKQIQYIKNNLTNIDENYHDLTSDTAKTEAGDYTVKVAPKSNYCWNSGTFEEKSFNWKINVLKLEKPSAAVTTFEWDGTSKALTISDFDNNYESQTGTTSATNVNSYSVTYKLRNKTSCTWTDNSTDDVVINWRIERQKLSPELSTFAQADALTYTGSTYYIKDHLTGYNSTYHDLSSDTSKSAAGTYTVKITPKSTYAFSDGTYEAREVQWTIQPLSVDMPVADNTDFVYDGKSHAPTVTGFNSSYMTRSGDYGNKTALGNYKITYTLKNTTNTRWADGSVEPYVINWSIGLTKVEFPYLVQNEFVYDGTEHTAVLANFDSDTMVISTTASDIMSATDAFEQYCFYVTLKDTTKNVWEDGSNSKYPVYWTIKRKPLTAAQSTGFAQSGTLNYNGSNQTVSITNFDANYHQLSGQYISANAGTFVAKITPRYNYCWNNGSSQAIPVVWTIDPLKLVKPSASGTTDFEYDKQAHSLSVQNFNDTYMTQKGDATTQTNTGFYTTVYSLKSTTNTTWDDDSVADVPVSWSISKNQLPKPILSKNHSYKESPYREQYNYYSNIIGIANYDGTYMSFTTTVPENFLGGSSNGYDMAYGAVGTYTITYHLTSDLVVWEGGDTADFTLTVIVTPAPLTAEQSNPYQSAIPTYTGGNINIVSENYIKGYYVRSGVGGQVWSGETSASTVGEHTAYVEPDENHTWQDGTRTKKTVKWRIAPAQIDKPTLDSSVTLTYDGNSKSPTLSGYDSAKMTLGGDVSAINAGVYTITVTPTSDYVWKEDGSNNTLSFDWAIEKTVVTTPAWNYTGNGQNVSLTSKGNKTTLNFTYNGTPFIPANYFVYDSDTSYIYNTTNINSSYTTASGISVQFRVNDANNQNFKAQKGNAILAYDKYYLSFYISPIYIPVIAPEYAPSFPYDGKSHAVVNINSQYSGGYTVTGTRSTSAAGNYTCTITANSGYKFRLTDTDGNLTGTTASSVTYTWQISDSVLAPPTLAQDYFDYGGTKTITINGFDSSTMTKTGTESASARGFYTITFKLKNTGSSVWSTGGTADIVKEWAIGTKRIAKPTLNLGEDETTVEFDYDGSTKNINSYISGYDANTMQMTGYLSATDAGSYTVSFTPRTDTGVTYVWQDSTSAAVTFTWKINRQALPDVTFKQQVTTSNLFYNGESQTVTITNFDAATMTISGDTAKTNAGTYTAKITPKPNYCWSDSTYAAKSVSWIIYPQKITQPTAVESFYEYTGSEVNLKYKFGVLTSDSYQSAVTRTNISATAPGSYTATFSLNDKNNYCWKLASGTTTNNQTISWSIGAAFYEVPTISPKTQQFALPTVTYSVTPSDYDSNAISATGLSKTFVHTDFNTSTNKATVSATFTLVNYPNAKWADGQSGATRTVTWEVTAASIATGSFSSYAESSAYLGAKYDGNTHYWYELNHTSDPTVTYDYNHNVTSASTPSYFKTISGTTSATNAGEYTVSLTPANWCYWSTGGRAAKTIKWAIEKIFPNTTFSQDSVTLNDDNLSATVDFTTKSTGAVTVTSNDTSIATVSYNSSTKVITINAGLSGTTSILVSQAADTNYYAAAAKTITVTVSRSLNSLSWAQINTLAKNGTLASQYRVGSCKVTPYFEATIGNAQTSVWAFLYSILIGVDHNSGIEGKGRAHFMNIIKMPNDTKERIFIESGYGTTSLDNYFNIYGTTASEAFPTTSSYNFSKIRSVCNQFLNALPAELQNVIVACKKFSHVNVSRYTDHTPYSSTTDKIWIPSMREITGQSTGNSYVDARVKQYDYFANGNSRTFYGFNSVSKANYWTRDQVDTDNNPNDTPYPADCYYIDVNGNPALAQGKYSYGFLPCFTIGGE